MPPLNFNRERDVASPRAAGVYQDAFRGLRSLGFREGDVHGALDRIRARSSSPTPTIEQVLRAALAALTPEPRAARRADSAVPQASA